MFPRVHLIQVFAVWRGGDLPHRGAFRLPHLRSGILLCAPFCGAHGIFTIFRLVLFRFA